MKTFLIIFSVLLSLTVIANDGNTIFIKGNVTINNQLIKKGFKIKEGQTIVTDKNSFGIFQLNEGSTFKITPSSSLKIEKIKKNTNKTSLLNLLKGKAFFHYNKKMKNGLKVKAKSVSMGVRGTEFFISYHKEDIWMCVNEGVVAVQTTDDKSPIFVKEGQGVLINKGMKTTPPKVYPWTKKLNWNLNPEKGSIESSINIQDAYSDPLDEEYD